ncbi:MAG: hypothetical protein OXB88_07570 [Bacteriovoracales bacterium]|nr:hypothetical protein [Bacteriovoracales bacterium]
MTYNLNNQEIEMKKKTKKSLLFLALGAICIVPTMAFGQVTTSCPDCSHVVPYFKGPGGLIATTDGADEVVYLATCGNVVRSGTLTASTNGTVAMSFVDENIVCDENNASLEIGPITDGGWYWLTGATNSAVGSLVNKSILNNTRIMPTNPGSSVTILEGNGANFLEHPASGRIGILPTIVPEPPVDPLGSCGAYRVDEDTIKQKSSDCALGDGSAYVRVEGPGNYGRRTPITNGMISRNYTGDVTVKINLWSNGGVVSTDTTSTPIGTGYRNLGDSLSLSQVVIEGPSPSVTLEDVLGDANASSSQTVVEGTADNSGDHVIVTIEGADSSDYCTDSRSQNTTISIYLVSNSDTEDNLLPAVKALSGSMPSTLQAVHGKTTLTIKCPPPSANKGQNLVPSNPFPTDRNG